MQQFDKNNIFIFKLFVAVPPDRPVIFDVKRRDRTKLLEPYNEGSDINLICEVSGGKLIKLVTHVIMLKLTDTKKLGVLFQSVIEKIPRTLFLNASYLYINFWIVFTHRVLQELNIL